MLEYVYLFLGCSLVSGAISYAWWMRVRVIDLRQDIFDVRDELFDCALEFDGHDDPAYKLVREHLNTLASTAPIISLMLLASVLGRNIPEGFSDFKKKMTSSDPRLQEGIELALSKSSDRVCRYLIFETFTGIVAYSVSLVVNLSGVLASQMLVWTTRWVNSDNPKEFQQKIILNG